MRPTRQIGELGVGMSTLPHAIKELAELALLEELDRVAIRTIDLRQSLWPRNVERAELAGDVAELIPIPNAGHFEIVSTQTPAWPIVSRAILGQL